MKRFSAPSVSADHHAALNEAASRSGNDPLTLMTDTQWFLYKARDTAFYTAYTKSSVDRAKLREIVAHMIDLAPQLVYYFDGATPGVPPTEALLDSIVSIVDVDDFDGYPDKVLDRGLDLYERKGQPLFRVTAYVRRGGPDAAGRASMVYVQASHALLEGADSASLTRSQSAAHGMRPKAARPGLFSRIGAGVTAALITGLIFATTHVGKRSDKVIGFRTVTIARSRLKKLASVLDVRQRSLYFALITYAMNGSGAEKAFSNRKIRSAYTLLDTGTGTVQADDFFRARAVMANFDWSEDFETYLRGIDATVGKAEEKDTSRMVRVMGNVIAFQRRLARVVPAMFGPRFWEFAMGTHLGMTMVPPHHAAGALGKEIVEPIHCGVWHTVTNVCTLTPGRRCLTLNFAIDDKLLPNVGRILPLLDEVERRHGIVPAAVPVAARQNSESALED